MRDVDSFFEPASRGERAFRFGLEASTQAAACAGLCPDFLLDDEDECVADEEVSCYNCRLRRWRADGFTCQCRRGATEDREFPAQIL